MKISQVALVGLLATQGVQAQPNEEVWVAQLNGSTPRMVNVRMNTEGAVCKLLNGQKVFIVPSKQSLPGTDSFRDLTLTHVSMIKKAPNCPSDPGKNENRKGMTEADL